MTDIEKYALAIANKYVGQFSLEQKIKKLGEELVELALGIAREDIENIEEEIGDMVYLLLHIACTTKEDCPGLDYYIKLAADKMERRGGTKFSHVNKL